MMMTVVMMMMTVVVVMGRRLAFDPTPMVSHMTLPPFWGRVECEKVAFLAAKRGSRR